MLPNALQNAFTVEGPVLLLAGIGVWYGKKWAGGLTITISAIGACHKPRRLGTSSRTVRYWFGRQHWHPDILQQEKC